jgi:trk system potassium uptake protein TrkH
MVFSGSNVFDSLCLSLSGISSGGLMPKSGPLDIYVNQVGVSVLSVACLIGAMNIAVLHDCFRLKNTKAFFSLLKNVEHKALIAFVLILFFIGVIYSSFGSVFAILIESIFFISTTGFNYAIDGLENIPVAILISLSLIGGSALSTAGGLKIIRILLLFRHLGTDMNRLSHPSRILPVLFRGQHIPDRSFLSIWMYFFGYTIFFGISICLLGASGLTFDSAVMLGAASISNFGPLMQYIPIESGFSMNDLTEQQKVISSFFMISGRVEVLAVLILFTPSFWRQ